MHVHLRWTQIKDTNSIFVLTGPWNLNHRPLLGILYTKLGKGLDLPLDMAIVIFAEKCSFLLCRLHVEVLVKFRSELMVASGTYNS